MTLNEIIHSTPSGPSLRRPGSHDVAAHARAMSMDDLHGCTLVLPSGHFATIETGRISHNSYAAGYVVRPEANVTVIARRVRYDGHPDPMPKGWDRLPPFLTVRVEILPQEGFVAQTFSAVLIDGEDGR